jgi:Pyridoxamine 5'-phosphate oxidase
MARWADLESARPEMAKLGWELIERFRVAYLGTCSPEHGPMIHPVTPIPVAGGLYAGIITKTPKYRNLTRDPRYSLHSPPGPRDAEFVIRGHARAVAVAELERLRAEDSRLALPAGDVLFELDIDFASYAEYRAGPDGWPRAERTRWLPEAEVPA